MDLGLTGRTAFVTGASAGIGRRVAELLGEEGMHVAVFARREDALADLAAELHRLGLGRCVAVAGDVTSPADLRAAGDRVLAEFGRVDVVVNCAGRSYPLTLSAGDDEWQAGMELKFFSYRRVAGLFLDGMIATGFGRVVNVTGTSESDGLNAAHSATAAVHAWSKGLSREVGPAGVTVNSIAPQRVLSEQLSRKWRDPVAREAEAKAHIPAGRFGVVDDVARVVAFLASPMSGFITGEVIHVDGGVRRHSF